MSESKTLIQTIEEPLVDSSPKWENSTSNPTTSAVSSSSTSEENKPKINNEVKSEETESADVVMQDTSEELEGSDHSLKGEVNGELTKGLKRSLAQSENGDKHEDSSYPDETAVKDEDAHMIVVPPAIPQLNYVPLKTGLCYDVRMRYHAKIFTSYSEYVDPHPEDPRRIYRIYKILAESGLIRDPSLSGVDDIGDFMLKIPVREATAEEVLQVHTKDHLKFIESTTSMSRERLLEETEKGDSVYFNNDSFLSAKLSCGGAIEACKAVVEGRVKNALAIVRPPGHHAEPDSPGGFCLFSNVAVAAKAILNSYPESVRRIIIVDWDVHHGNGTQKSFIDDPRVLYISLHRYEGGKFYPGTKFGSASQCGEGKGEGFSVNIPWPCAGLGDGDYIYAFDKVIMPICYEYDADLVIISSGFDAADGDHLGGCFVSPGAYGHMTHMLKSLSKGNLCVVLEGGYSLDAIAKSALAVAKVLVGEPPGELKSKLPKPEAIETIDEVVRIQAKYWKSMKPGHGGIDSKLPDISSNFKLNDPIRSYQSHILFSKYNYITLPILLDMKRESPSFEDQVMASPDIYDASTIIISVHDPPEVWAQINPTSGNIDSSNSIIIDSTLKLIEWAQKEKYGFIDVNVPFSITGSEDDTYNATIASQEILLYLWDNFIQYFSATKIVFYGFGDSYAGVVHLLGHREIRDLVKASINFLNTHALRAIVPLIDESMTDWFFRNSLVFTSPRHSCWGGEGGEAVKKPRRKFGRVLRADSDGLDNIIDERFEEGLDFVLDSIEEES